MGKMLKETEEYKHIIRADGSIRIATTAPIEMYSDELCVLSPTLRTPGLWSYDRRLSSFTEMSAEQTRRARAAKLQLKEARAESRARSLEELRYHLSATPMRVARLHKAIKLLAELSIPDLQGKKGR